MAAPEPAGNQDKLAPDRQSIWNEAIPDTLRGRLAGLIATGFALPRFRAYRSGLGGALA